MENHGTEIRGKSMEKKKTLENPWIKKGRSGELDNFT
jgi:hypothetical protein